MDNSQWDLEVNGQPVKVDDPTATLLAVLRDQLGLRSVKDGCSPQGQCGCCTVLVDGQPRVSCVTPARRVRGRSVTTVEGLDESVRSAWGEAFASVGGSQCGFCTPGIINRFEGLRAKGVPPGELDRVRDALLAHLCRCTGWQTVLDAWSVYGTEVTVQVGPNSEARAAMEGGTAQAVGPHVALGDGGFADDAAPGDALVAVPMASGEGWAVGETRAEAVAASGKVQGRRTAADFGPPIALPDGEFDVVLQTSWVEPGYLETDASWCEPGGEPASVLGNGGAFGGKETSGLGETARRLADQYGRPVRVLLAREDVVRYGPKRPPMAAGIHADGSGVVRVARTPGITEAITAVAPGLKVEEVDCAGPPTSVQIRGAGWLEAAVLLAAARREVGWITAPSGGSATATIGADGLVEVWVRAGQALDPTVLRSYCVGAAHMGLSLVRGEALSVAPDGEVHDLTIRSFGILRAVDTPEVQVHLDDDGPPVNGSDAVMAAVAAAAWIEAGLPPRWPLGI